MAPGVSSSFLYSLLNLAMMKLALVDSDGWSETLAQAIQFARVIEHFHAEGIARLAVRGYFCCK